MPISLLGTGGTIASRQTEQGVVAQVRAAELLASVDSDLLPDGLEVATRDVGTRPSFAFRLADMRGIAEHVLEEIEHGADGVVVLHGTDSMEETSFLVDLMHDGRQPVVFTGAQRPFDSPNGDGAPNIARALSVAASPESRDRGVMVVFDRRVWPARHVRKVHTVDADAFAVVGSEPLDLNVPSTLARSTLVGARAALSADVPRVDVVALTPGGDGSAVRDAVVRGPAGLVIQALGVGNASPEDAAAIGDAVRDGVAVVLTTRVVSGAVHPIYGGGGGADLLNAGVLFAGRMSTPQARVLLATTLATSPGHSLAAFGDWLDATRSN